MSKLFRHNQTIITHKGSAGSLDSLDTVDRERYVSGSSVPAVERPLGFAMADDKDPRSCHGDVSLSLFLVSLIGQPRLKVLKLFFEV